MDILSASELIPWRAGERLLIVAVGAMCIYLGYRLFWSMREFKSDGEGKVDLPGGISIHLSRVGPGTFFALFGALIIGTSIVTPLNIEVHEPASAPSGQSAAALPSIPTAVPSTSPVASISTSLSYATDRADVAINDQQRAAVLRDLDTLALLQPALQQGINGKPFTMAGADATRLMIALPDIRMQLLLSTWDGKAWGDRRTFSQWIDNGYEGPPPDGNAIAAALFLGNRPAEP